MQVIKNLLNQSRQSRSLKKHCGTDLKTYSNKLRITLGFMQVGLDVLTSANCKSQLQFQQTNNYQLLFLTSSKYFQSAAVIGRRNTNSQPA